MKSGEEIGPFRLIQRLDQEAGPGVWKAQSLTTNGFTGLRLIDVGAGEANFVDHMTAVHALVDPKIHPLEGFGVHEGRFGWVAQTPHRGMLLSERIRQGDIPYAEALTVAEDIMEALVVAHEAQIYHGALTAEDVTLGIEGWVTSNLGLNDLVPGALLAMASDDLDAVKALLRQMVPRPPPSLRALLNGGPNTAVAFLRALQTLPIDEGTPTPAEKAPSEPPASASRPVPARPAMELGPAGADDAESSVGLEPIDSWGVDLAGEPAHWVDRDRDLIKTSSTRGAGGENSWGLSETGPNVVLSDEESGFGAPQIVALLVLLTAGILAALFVLKSTSSTPVTADDSMESALELADDEGDENTEAVAPPEDVDAGRPPGVVDVTFSPVAVRVLRIEDGKTVCDGARVCRLPIDIDYRAEHADFEPLHISGDDLYDRRDSGRWRLVLQPKAEPEPRQKRRQRRP